MIKKSACVVCVAPLAFDAGEALASAADQVTDLLAPLCVGCCVDRLVASRGGLAFRFRPPQGALIDPGRVVVTPRAVAVLMASGVPVEAILKRHANLLDSARVVTAVKVGRVDLWVVSDIRADGESGSVVMCAGESRAALGGLPLTA